MRRFIVPLVGLGVLACEPEDVVQPAPPEFRIERTELPRVPTIDDRLAALSDDIPGFGGIFYDSTGELNIQLKDVTGAGEARERVAQWFGDRGDTWSATKGVEDAGRARTRAATYDYRELHTWFLTISRAMKDLNLTGGAISSRKNRVIVYVGDEGRFADVRSAIAGLGVPADAVIVEFSLGAQFMTSLRSKVRPTLSGLEVDNETGAGPCTLGYNMDRSATSSWFLVTAAHCSASGGELDTWDTIGQPNTSAGNALGDEVADPPTFDHDDVYSCPTGANCRWSDAALFQYSGYTWKHGYIAWPNIGSYNYTTEKQIVLEADPIEGQTLHKVGRTTGRTSGVVQEECRTITNGSGWYMLCQIETDDDDVGGGDSGSPVVFTWSSDVVAAGLMWGSIVGNNHMMASNFSLVRTELQDAIGYTLCAKISCSPPPTVSISGHTYIPPGVQCTWTANATGGVSPYSYSWSGLGSGSGSTTSPVLYSSGTITVQVTDDVSHTDTYNLYVTVSGAAPTPNDCLEEEDS